jgi:hypothetical protein
MIIVMGVFVFQVYRNYTELQKINFHQTSPPAK